MTERIRAAVRINLPKIDPLYVWSALIGLVLALVLIAIGTVLNRPRRIAGMGPPALPGLPFHRKRQTN